MPTIPQNLNKSKIKIIRPLTRPSLYSRRLSHHLYAQMPLVIHHLHQHKPSYPQNTLEPKVLLRIRQVFWQTQNSVPNIATFHFTETHVSKSCMPHARIIIPTLISPSLLLPISLFNTFSI